MARTSNAKILEWGTPPEPEPTGWDAIVIELGKRPGEWANIGDFSAATARKIGSERFPTHAGYETRPVLGKDGKTAVWVRFTGTDAGAVETRSADDAAPDADAPAKPRTVKRGSVV